MTSWALREITAVVLPALFGAMLPATPTAVQAQEPECPWMDTSLSDDERAQLLLDASTLEQKFRWLVEQPANEPTRTEWPDGVVYPVQVPCTPLIQYTDGPPGIRDATGVTAFPVPIAVASTWDPSLSYAKGQAMADEAWNKRRNVILAPGLASGRTPLSGRNSEYMGEDPLLGGILAGTEIRGIQEGNPGAPVVAVLKHYVGNEQELDRGQSSSNVDERTLHEIYNLPFEIAIKEGDPGGIMCAYNQVNGVYSCENPTILNDYLKNEIGFDGFVVSDFRGVHSTAPSLVGGLDQELNRPIFFTPDLLNAALAAGEITEAQIDEAAFRVVRAHIAAGLFDYLLPPEAAENVSTPENQAVALKIAEEGTVLLKNQDGILPLGERGRPDKGKDRDKHNSGRGHGSDREMTIAVIGPTASNTPTDGVSASTVCSAVFPFPPPGGPFVDCPSPVAPLDVITARAAQDGSTVTFDNGSDLASAAATAAEADIAIVFGYYTMGEFNDRPNLSLDNNGDALILAVAAANPNTIVVLETGSAVLMPWLEDVKAVLQAWYPGVQQGTAIAKLLWGDVNPSGKLPMTFPKSEADTPTAGSEAQYPGIVDDDGIRQVDYTEGLFVGYRWYDNEGIEPLFPFGYGLSYTTFEYSHLQVTPRKVQADKEIRVHFRVANTGSVAGTEIAQVYLSLPAGLGEPPKRLVGWARVTLEPGKHENVKVRIDPTSSAHPLSYWDTSADSWTTAAGDYTFYVGSSSRDLPLSDTVKVWTR